VRSPDLSGVIFVSVGDTDDPTGVSVHVR